MSVKEKSVDSFAKVIISFQNYKDLSGIVLSLKERGVSTVVFSQVAVPGLSSENHSLLVPAKDMLPHLLKAVQVARREGLICLFEDLPLCLLPGEEENFIFKSGSVGVKMQFCLACELSPRCGGITKAQLIAEYGTQLLSWQFLFPKDFFTQEDIAFLDEQLLKEGRRV